MADTTLDNLFALAPSIAIASYLNSKDAGTMLMVTIGGFSALCASLVMGLFHAINMVAESPLVLVLLSIVVNESMRFLLLKIFGRYNKLSQPKKNPTEYTAQKLASLALGYGFTQSLLFYGSLIAKEDAGHKFQLIALFNIAVFFHLGSMNFAYEGYMDRDLKKISVALTSHVVLGIATLLPSFLGLSFNIEIFICAIIAGVLLTLKYSEYKRVI